MSAPSKYLKGHSKITLVTLADKIVATVIDKWTWKCRIVILNLSFNKTNRFEVILVQKWPLGQNCKK